MIGLYQKLNTSNILLNTCFWFIQAFEGKKLNLNELMRRSFSRCQKGSCLLTFCGVLILRRKAKESLVKYV